MVEPTLTNPNQGDLVDPSWGQDVVKKIQDTTDGHDHDGVGSKACSSSLEYTGKLADQYNQIIAGTWVHSLTGSQFLQGMFRNTSHAQNDELDYTFTHKAGTYTLCVLGVTDPNHGIITVSMDGSTQGTIDWYSAVLTWNVLKTLSVTIATSGSHTLNIKVTDKNVAAGNHYYDSSHWWIR